MNVPNPPIALRSRILQVSFAAFNARGYRNVPMDSIARSLRISKKTIYKHFNAKEEILELGVEDLFEDIEERLQAALWLAEDADAMQAYFGVYRDFVLALTPLLRSEIEVEMPYLHERINTFERQVLSRSFAALLKDLRSRGGIDYPSPTREFTNSFFAMLRGLVDAPEDKAHFILGALYKGMQKA